MQAAYPRQKGGRRGQETERSCVRVQDATDSDRWGSPTELRRCSEGRSEEICTAQGEGVFGTYIRRKGSSQAYGMLEFIRCQFGNGLMQV